MPAARYTQGRGLKFEDVAVPALGEGDLLLDVEAAGICGTDVKIAANGHRKLADGQSITLGHEFIGRIAAVNGPAGELKVGQRVGVAPNLGCGTCEMCLRGLMNMCPNYTAFGITFDGGLASRVKVPAKAVTQGCVVPVSESIDPAVTVLAEPMSCALNGLRAARPEVGDTCLVYGAGPMGLLCAMLASIMGCVRVVVADRHDSRLALAKDVGATDVIDVRTQSVSDWVKRNAPAGVDVVVAAVPSAAVQQESLQILAPYGRLSLFAGLARRASEVPIDTNVIHYKNLLVTGTSGGSPRDYRDALKLIESGRLKADRLVSHRFGFGDIAGAFDAAMSKRGQKIVVVKNA